MSFLHHSVHSGLLKFGFSEAFKAFWKASSIWILSSKYLLIVGSWAILSGKHWVCNVVFHLSPQIGTNQIAVCAKAQNKPFYVVAESFKFVRLFPLNQQDVPDRFKVRETQLPSYLAKVQKLSVKNCLLSISDYLDLSAVVYFGIAPR